MTRGTIVLNLVLVVSSERQAIPASRLVGAYLMNSLTRFVAVAVVCAPVWAQVSPDINALPSREFGHSLLTFGTQSVAPNLVEGRELNSPSAIAFDTTVTPAILYVADSSNHRILGFRNPSSFTTGQKADKVIGQREL